MSPLFKKKIKACRQDVKMSTHGRDRLKSAPSWLCLTHIWSQSDCTASLSFVSECAGSRCCQGRASCSSTFSINRAYFVERVRVGITRRVRDKRIAFFMIFRTRTQAGFLIQLNTCHTGLTHLVCTWAWQRKLTVLLVKSFGFVCLKIKKKNNASKAAGAICMWRQLWCYFCCGGSLTLTS